MATDLHGSLLGMDFTEVAEYTLSGKYFERLNYERACVECVVNSESAGELLTAMSAHNWACRITLRGLRTRTE